MFHKSKKTLKKAFETSELDEAIPRKKVIWSFSMVSLGSVGVSGISIDRSFRETMGGARLGAFSL